MSTRILAGQAKGRSLRVPASARPTPARVRKSLFDVLAHTVPPAARFLDLYAGAGAVGLEAASRGYVVTLVERDPRAANLIQTNARELGLAASTRVVRADARAFVQQFVQQIGESVEGFEIVFVDPPYSQNIAQVTERLLGEDHRQLITPGGVLIVQAPEELGFAPAHGFTFERREYGTNALTFYWREG